jgi:hypothetical protein
MDPVYGAQHQAKFAAEMSAGRQLHEEGLLAKDAVEAAGLMEQLQQPVAEKAKEAEGSLYVQVQRLQRQVHRRTR